MSLMPLLRLLRIPAVFTTFPDVLAGYAIVQQGEIAPLELTGLLAASGCLYLSGMVWNDLFDIKQDLVERPNRPLPAREIRPKFARLLASVLMLAGVCAALLVSMPAFFVSLALAGAIMAYDAGGKKTSAGPLLMGLCRGFNVLLGAACVTSFNQWGDYPALIVAVVMTLYVCGITLFARSEAQKSAAWPLTVGLILSVLALLAWGVIAAVLSTGSAVMLVVVMLILIAFQVLRRALPAIRSREPAQVQQTVRAMLLTIPMLEAIVIIAHGGPHSMPMAIAAALMMIPGIILSRYIPMT
ncbi:UbiA family prenyltransferase [uncultured Rubinisphaera sp.]|uniref:UbiA family prenyltransferase n=2 Tax=Rubinisphaera TaxID=1649490 RepID=UPI000C0EB1A5|nr:hypothetical protein [Rubinisphaera sp.]HCS54559.1 hypothetical protein [Planctomycetaceae bacterium]|tara:strand:- start:13468 stop:14364 length:897 start_codon:yes stop_codon:yes gene_type:complete